MKKLLFLIIVLIAIAGNNLLIAQSILDLGKCNLQITEIKEISSFKGARSGEVKPSRRDAKFLEIKVEGIANSDGLSGWYPNMFGALFTYRGALRITPAIAIGIKSKDPLSNKTLEQWFNDPDVSYTAKYNQGDKIVSYIIIEVARETTDFMLQGPVIITKRTKHE